MSVTSMVKDTERLTMVVTAEYDAGIEQVWELWSDPRKLERWWGPPTYPATVVEHDLVQGGRVTYFMTGPEGDAYHGWWNVLEVEAPRRLVLEDGFADEAGNHLSDMPVATTTMELASKAGGGTTMTMQTLFPSLDAMQQLVEMGMDEGLRAAMGQIDAILAGDPTG